MCAPQSKVNICNETAIQIRNMTEEEIINPKKQSQFRNNFSPTTKKNNATSKKHKNKNKKSPKKKSKKQKQKQQQNKPAEQQQLTLEEQGRYVALDCEFVGVGPGGYEHALARVSLVDWNNAVLLDTHVRVSESTPVTDYRTFVSGVREEHLLPDVAMESEKCIAIVKKLLQGRILVGHGLKNDLTVLGITHPWYNTRDTAKYEPFMKKAKKVTDSISTSTSTLPRSRKLKDLALTKLDRVIQKEGESHCSIEDSIAALDLYKKARGKWEKVMEYKVGRTQEIECDDAMYFMLCNEE
uniref:RNA exonuclease 4 n=2 Tax=Chaetoceros debilis TaxID=122233 RepID=A0A7S3Q7X7_9STRA